MILLAINTLFTFIPIIIIDILLISYCTYIIFTLKICYTKTNANIYDIQTIQQPINKPYEKMQYKVTYAFTTDSENQTEFLAKAKGTTQKIKIKNEIEEIYYKKDNPMKIYTKEDILISYIGLSFSILLLIIIIIASIL